MVVNLEFIKAIVTAQEVMLLNPLESKVVDFIDRLKQQLPMKSPTRIDEYNGTITTNQPELPFEFQILEICLETICSFLESSVLELENNAYPILDDLAMNVSTKNLERVRSLKSNLTRLLARVQKVHTFSAPLYNSFLLDACFTVCILFCHNWLYPVTVIHSIEKID